MLSFFPKQIAKKGLVVYLVALVTISVFFNRFFMPMEYVLIGLISVFAFFFLSSWCSKKWGIISSRAFEKKLFWSAFAIRVFVVLFFYWFCWLKTGTFFEFDAADSIGYHNEAEWLCREKDWNYIIYYFFTSRNGVSDSGYGLYLTTLYKLVGPNIFVARVLKALYGGLTCVFLYRLVLRTVNDKIGRIAGIFFAFMPNLLFYCGHHVKEIEMLLLLVLFLERSDWLMRGKKISIVSFIVPLLLGGTLFLFRTVLGVVAFFALITSLVFSEKHTSSKARRLLVGLWILGAIAVLASGPILNEVDNYWNEKETNVEDTRGQQVRRGNQWAKYATGTVMAPIMFVLPFSTMVDTGQYNQNIMNGGNFVRNYMGFFVALALYVVIKKKKWRDFSLIGAYTVGYLGVLALSGFSNAERFLLPALPGLIIMWAYGLSQLNVKSYNLIRYWGALVIAIEFGWAFFKLGSRSIL